MNYMRNTHTYCIDDDLTGSCHNQQNSYDPDGLAFALQVDAGLGHATN